MAGGLAARSDSSRATSRSMSRCLRSASRIAASAVATSSATAAKAARQSAIGRASPLSPMPAGEVSAKRSANLRRAVAAAIAPCRLARSSFSASMRLSSSGRLTGGAARGGLVSMAPMVSFVPASPSTRSEDGSSVSGKSFATSVVVAARNVKRDDARNAGAVGIDGDGIDRRRGVDIGGLRRHGGKCGNNGEARRDETVRNRSHGFPSGKSVQRAQYPGRSGNAGRVKVTPPHVMRRCDQGTGSIEVTVRRRQGGAWADRAAEASYPPPGGGR